MKAQTLTPFQIFGNQVRYLVPMFQRPYVWTREAQWEPLWEDVRTVADRFLEGEPTADASVAHFLGAIVLDEQPGPTGFIEIRHIVDGQQRLTTLQLLLDAAQWIAQQHGDPADASALGALVLNNSAIAASPDDIFKVWPTNYDQMAFRAAMQDGETTEGAAAESKIIKAHDYFCEAITDWLEPTGDPDKVRARVHVLAMTLMQYLKIVVIDLEPGDNAQVIFETLNHRGTPLLAADLVKNLLFQRVAAENADTNSIYNEYWQPFDSEEWRRDVKQGRLFRPRIDLFMNYWLVMRCVREVPTDRVYADFRDYLNSTEIDAQGVFAALAAAGVVYNELETQPATSVEGTFYYRVLKIMESYVWAPFLLWLFSRSETELPVAQRHVALKAIESWSMRRMLCRLPTKGYNQLVLELLGHVVVADADQTVGDRVLAFLATQTADSRFWPDDEAVRTAIQHQPLYRGIRRARLRMLLEALEDDLRGPLTEEQHCPRGNLTIEHVMPRGWREHWVTAGADDQMLALTRDPLLHTLGNLTLVNNKLNPTLSNRPWTDAEAVARNIGDKGKRSILADHSVLHLNKKVIAEPGWNEDVIKARGKALAERIIFIWPAPDAIAE